MSGSASDCLHAVRVLPCKLNQKKIAYYQLGRHRVLDYLPGILAAIILLFGFPFLVQSQQSAEIRDEYVADGRFVLFGRGGNTLASLGDQGVMIVDSQFPDMVPKYQSTIRALGGGELYCQHPLAL